MSYPLVNIQRTMENHHFLWENSLFIWPFSIAIFCAGAWKTKKGGGMGRSTILSQKILNNRTIPGGHWRMDSCRSIRCFQFFVPRWLDIHPLYDDQLILYWVSWPPRWRDYVSKVIMRFTTWFSVWIPRCLCGTGQASSIYKTIFPGWCFERQCERETRRLQEDQTCWKVLWHIGWYKAAMWSLFWINFL